MSGRRRRTPHDGRLTVAFLGSRGLPARYGGFETLVETLAEGLPKERFKVTVFCERSLRRLRPSIPGVDFIYFPVFERLRIVTEAIYDIVSLLWAAFASVKIVVLFGYTASIFCAVPRIFGKRVLINVDGLEWKRRKFSTPIRILLRMAELMATGTATSIICDSHAIQAYYRERYHVESEYATNPAPNIGDARSALVKSLNLTPNSYYLVVARLEPENHIDTIIGGFIKSETTKMLVIVGPLIRTKYVKRLLEMRTERVIFAGGIYDRQALHTLRREAFAYLHGHEVGGTNPSLLESMACASPIIAYDVAFNREVARDASMYFSNEHELAANIRVLENAPEKRKQMGEGAQRIALTDYSAQRVVSQYIEILSKA